MKMDDLGVPLFSETPKSTTGESSQDGRRVVIFIFPCCMDFRPPRIGLVPLPYMAMKMAEKNCGDPNYGIKWDDPPSKCEAMHPTWVRKKKGYQWALQPWVETPKLPQRGISIELSSSYPSEVMVLEIVQQAGQKDIVASMDAATTSVLHWHWRRDVFARQLGPENNVNGGRRMIGEVLE